MLSPSYFDLPNAVNFYIPVNDEGDALGKTIEVEIYLYRTRSLFQVLGTFGPQEDVFPLKLCLQMTR